MKDDRGKCHIKYCTKVGTKCKYCWQLVCNKHSEGTGSDRICHSCLAEK